MSDKYAAITAHRGCYPVRLMCTALGVSVSGFYDAQARQSGPPSPRAVEDEQLLVKVRAAFRKGRRSYGAPRIQCELQDQGISIARKRVARLMREDQLVARARRRFVHTTDSAHAEPIAPNLLKRRFDPADYPIIDRAWVGDITYVPTREGWLFLAVLLDLSSRHGSFFGREKTYAVVLEPDRGALARYGAIALATVGGTLARTIGAMLVVPAMVVARRARS